MAGEVAALAAEAVPYAAAALGAYGAAVLGKAKDDLADATIGTGRRLLQRIFGRKQDDEGLPPVLTEVIENPGDEDYLSVLRLAIREIISRLRLQCPHSVPTACARRRHVAQARRGVAAVASDHDPGDAVHCWLVPPSQDQMPTLLSWHQTERLGRGAVAAVLLELSSAAGGRGV
jgi:hypothetical protein